MFFRAVTKNGRKAKILMYGEIGNGYWQPVSSEVVAKELEVLGDLDEIEVRINSPGGAITAGVAIYNTLKNHKAKVNIFIDGFCGSIATVVAMAGDTVTMGTGSTFMIHNPWSSVSGDSNKMKSKAQALEVMKAAMIDAYMTKVKITREELEAFMDKETFFTASQALEKGFITKLGSEDESKALVSGFDMESIKNCYARLSENEIDQIENSENNKGEENNNMTKDQFKNSHPQIYEEIRNEAIQGERERIKALDEISNEFTADEIINSAKYETFRSANEVSFEILKAMKGQGKNIVPQNKVETTLKNESFIEILNSKREDAETLKNIKSTEELKGKEEFDINKFAEEMAALAEEV